MELVKEYSYLTILWDPSCRSVITSWHGGFEGRDLQNGLNEGLRELKRRQPHAQWIGDTVDIGVISERDKDWIDRDWFPRFLETGAQYMAVVQPQSVIARLAVVDIVSKFPGSGLTVYNCASVDEAIAWMRKQEF
ncbi:MAG: hypothetical protein JXA67_07825 [Micromonosporaceae bacterium]|nr:hypothetical protein [Micromonosporaceae bacterium]